MNLCIEIVKNQKDWKSFLELPWRIYKGNEYWVPPLLADVSETLDTKQKPFLKHSNREIFLAR